MSNNKSELELAHKEIQQLTEQLYNQYKKNIELKRQVDYLKSKLESCENMLEHMAIIKLK